MWNYKMKILITSLIFFTIFCLIVIEYSYAQETGGNITETTQGFETTGGGPLLSGATPFGQTPEVFVQIIFRDSAGTLVGYVEGKPDIFAIVIVAQAQVAPKNEFSQIITVGPYWDSMNWICTSDKDFIVHGVLRGYEGAYLTISITPLGSQGLFAFDYERMQTFSVGASGDQTITITRTGTAEGWITLQTTADAEASCIQR